MPFGLKKASVTYQRLVDSTFQAQLGRNLEAYVDDMVINRKTKQSMIMDIFETFDNLRKINMKLNPKKCSFSVGEGKFLGYMVTSKGIRENLKKIKAVVDMQSPKTLREMQRGAGRGPKSDVLWTPQEVNTMIVRREKDNCDDPDYNVSGRGESVAVD
ncbi:reverse transcriptase domain-containing protein [Tanacetum coccineum]